ncbi:MAG: hypothetical protein HQ478_12790 [Chloroflexi bacterium]|nr:hypothetical protein [Chloroflexota bacterium]
MNSDSNPIAEMVMDILQNASEEDMGDALDEIEKVIGYENAPVYHPLTRIARDIDVPYHRLKYAASRYHRRRLDKDARQSRKKSIAIPGRRVTCEEMSFSIWLPDAWKPAEYFSGEGDLPSTNSTKVDQQGYWRAEEELDDPDAAHEVEVMQWKLLSIETAEELYREIKPHEDNISRATHPKSPSIAGMDSAAYYATWKAGADSTEQSSWYFVDGTTGWEITCWCSYGESPALRPMFRKIATSFELHQPA